MLKSFANGARAVSRRVPGALRDLLGLSGAGLIAYGAWLITPPAGFITGGVLLLAGAIVSGFGSLPAAEKAAE